MLVSFRRITLGARPDHARVIIETCACTCVWRGGLSALAPRSWVWSKALCVERWSRVCVYLLLFSQHFSCVVSRGLEWLFEF